MPGTGTFGAGLSALRSFISASSLVSCFVNTQIKLKLFSRLFYLHFLCICIFDVNFRVVDVSTDRGTDVCEGDDVTGALHRPGKPEGYHGNPNIPETEREREGMGGSSYRV